MANTGTHRVLLADDDEINRLIVQSILTEDKGYKVSTAADGRAALMACLTQVFDILIIDYKMPGISGDRLIKNLRASANPNTNTPVVLFSAATRQELAPVIQSSKIDCLVTKPITAASFLLEIENLLSRSRPCAVTGG